MLFISVCEAGRIVPGLELLQSNNPSSAAAAWLHGRVAAGVIAVILYSLLQLNDTGPNAQYYNVVFLEVIIVCRFHILVFKHDNAYIFET